MSTARPIESSCVALIAGVSEGFLSVMNFIARCISSSLVISVALPITMTLRQCVRPVIIVKGKQQKDMKNKEDWYDVVEIVPGEGLMQKPDAFGCNLGDYT